MKVGSLPPLLCIDQVTSGSANIFGAYLSNYLGHKGPIETYYYYHQVEDVFKTVRRKDAVSARVIPEVQYEN